MTAVWETTYKMSNGRRRARFIQDAFWPYVRRAAYKLVSEHPADLIVSVHPIPNMAVLRAMTKKTPYISVVTDLVSTHAMWYDRRNDLVVVPTQEAWQRGIKLGLTPNQMEVVGLPVADRFCHIHGSRQELRTRLGWPQISPDRVDGQRRRGYGPDGAHGSSHR